MTVVSFPPKEWTKPKTLEDWPWEPDLGKPHGNLYQDINGVANPPEAEVNDLVRYKDGSPATKILQEAAQLIDGDRATQNGNKLKNHQNIADHWNAYLAGRLSTPLTPLDVALMMVELKIARTKCGEHNPDDYRDMIGYGSIAGEFANGGC